MNAHYFQHVPFEGLGSIETWLTKKRYKISSTRLYLHEALPDPESIDFLIIMGGPMSVNDEALYPWLAEEKSFIRKTIHTGKPVLGICLGAQLIASCMGARVFPGSGKEIGWFPIFGTDRSDAFRFPEELTVFHWHGETFDLPADAVRLASSPECPNQAFQLNGKKVIGMQFHLETTSESLNAIIENCRDELVEGEKVMGEAEMKNVAPSHYPEVNGLMDRLLDFLMG